MNPSSSWVLKAVVIGVLALGVGYWVGSMVSYKAGYAMAKADIEKLQAEAAAKSADDAAKVANPFQTVNPLEGVESNPFEKAKKVLNPF